MGFIIATSQPLEVKKAGEDFVVMPCGFHTDDRVSCEILFNFFKDFTNPIKVRGIIVMDGEESDYFICRRENDHFAKVFRNINPGNRF